ncbi:hypothetical protein SAMN04487769_0381 [Burkholderia sp. b14]|nr:hypothetical protein SAMN04487769_0381 [Burkholderia sp. b14]
MRLGQLSGNILRKQLIVPLNKALPPGPCMGTCTIVSFSEPFYKI